MPETFPMFGLRFAVIHIVENWFRGWNVKKDSS